MLYNDHTLSLRSLIPMQQRTYHRDRLCSCYEAPGVRGPALVSLTSFATGLRTCAGTLFQKNCIVSRQDSRELVQGSQKWSKGPFHLLSQMVWHHNGGTFSSLLWGPLSSMYTTDPMASLVKPGKGGLGGVLIMQMVSHYCETCLGQWTTWAYLITCKLPKKGHLSTNQNYLHFCIDY